MLEFIKFISQDSDHFIGFLFAFSAISGFLLAGYKYTLDFILKLKGIDNEDSEYEEDDYEEDDCNITN